MAGSEEPTDSNWRRLRGWGRVMLLWFTRLVSSSPTWVIMMGTLIFELWLAVWIVLPRYYPDKADAGQLGDSFGVVTSLFSGLTLLGAGYAVYLQHEELKETKDQARKSDEERLETMRLLARQADALTSAAKLQAVNVIGQMDLASFQFHQGDFDRTSYRSLEPALARIESSRQFAQIQLLDAETPGYEWGGMEEEKQTPIRKYYLELLRRAMLSVRRIPVTASVFDPIDPLLELQREVGILGRQVDAKSMDQLLYFTGSRLEQMIVRLRAEGGVPPMEERANLTLEDFDLEGERTRGPERLGAERRAHILNSLQDIAYRIEYM